MDPSEFVPGQIYVVNQNGFRYNMKYLGMSYSTSPTGGRFYKFEPMGNRKHRNTTIAIHEKKIETAVEYPRYTQLALL